MKSVKFNKNESKQQGQVLLIVLLVMGAALSIGVAISSRSIGTLTQTTTTEESVDCLAAAEAGIEDALQILDEGSYSDYCDEVKLSDGTWNDPSDPDANIISCDLDAGACGGSSEFQNNSDYDNAYCIWEVNSQFDWNNVGRDTTFQVDVRDATASGSSSIDIHWTGDAIVEFSIIGSDDATGEVEKIDVGAYDPDVTDGCDLNGTNYPDQAWTASSELAGGQVINVRIPGQLTQFPSDNIDVRVKFLCQDVDQARIIGKNCVGLGCIGQQVDLPVQYYQVNSMCLNKPVTRELEAKKTFPAMPTIFDFGIFSGSETNQLAP